MTAFRIVFGTFAAAAVLVLIATQLPALAALLAVVGPVLVVDLI